MSKNYILDPPRSEAAHSLETLPNIPITHPRPGGRGGLTIGNTGDFPGRLTGLGRPAPITNRPLPLTSLASTSLLDRIVKCTIIHERSFTDYNLYSHSWFPHPACNTADPSMQHCGSWSVYSHSWIEYCSCSELFSSRTPAKLKRTFKFHFWGNVSLLTFAKL